MRYIVGIDLGTTNTVVAYSDTSAPEAGVRLFEIPQVMAPGTVEARAALPSFLYFPPESEMRGGIFALPWRPEGEQIVAGEYARRRAAETPHRVVSSAKSWLSHLGVDRTAPILPQDAAEDLRPISPVEASTAYLRHVREAWNHAFPAWPLQEQEVLLTVPASFDASARELTARAAAEAGLEHVTLLEEPQAAFYAWIHDRGDSWRDEVGVGDRIVVVDIGGGTTDFSLIAVAEQAGELVLERVAVGNHILLGGDNMDLTLAHRVAARTAVGAGLDPWQFRALTAACREAKERLLGAGAPDSVAVGILGRGRSVVGGAVRTEIRREDAEEVLLDGFFPHCAMDEGPRRATRTALREQGLPYEADPAITRHLAAFLSRHPAGSGAIRPTAVLFNGGVMRSSRLRERLLEVLQGWPGDGEVRALAAADPDRAVARGAAYYGMARRGRGIRIRGGAARSYYVGVEAAMPAVPGVPPPIRALCVVPFGMEEGTEVEVPGRELRLLVGEAAEFRFLGSTVRQEDTPGTLVEAWAEGEIEELSPVEVTLQSDDPPGTAVPVRLQARLTEVGVLELWCVRTDDPNQRWKLEFHARAEG